MWHNGRWVEVCIDDRLPFVSDELLGLQSDHQDEFWPAVLEKACAQFVFIYFMSSDDVKLLECKAGTDLLLHQSISILPPAGFAFVELETASVL